MRGVTKEIRKQSKLRHRRRILHYAAYSVGAILGIVVLVVVLRLEFLRATEVAIAGTREVSAELVKGTVQEHLTGTFFGIIPRDALLLVSSATIAESIKGLSPEIERVSVRKHFGRLDVSIQERTPAYQFCATTCYFVDRQGVVFEETARISGSRFPEVSIAGTEETSPVVLLGNRLFPAEDARTLEAVLGVLQAREMPVQRATFFPHYLQIVTSGPEIFISRPVDVETWKTQFAAVLASERIAQELPQTIDMRYGTKVYVKFGNSF